MSDEFSVELNLTSDQLVILQDLLDREVSQMVNQGGSWYHRNINYLSMVIDDEIEQLEEFDESE